MKKLLLIDGNSLLFRAYYSTIYTNPLKTSSGVPTNAVFGFISMLNKAVSMVNPDAILVAWDAGKKTFRHDKMADYKGTRKPLDEELIVQMPIVREFLDEAGYVRYEQEGYEADDIIGSVAAGAPDMETTILTGDKDLLQLVNDTTKVLMMRKGLQEVDTMDEKAIEEKYGLKPIQITDLKGLMGDASDNIPGVKGIGEKTALKLLHEYGTLENTYAHIDEIKGKRREYLERDKEQALLSKEMATIYTEMKLPFDIPNLEFKGEKESADSFYHKYEMGSLLNRVKTVREPAKGAEVIVKDHFLGEMDTGLILLPVANQESFMHQHLFGFLYIWKDSVYFISAENALKDEDFIEMLKEDKTLVTWDVKETMHLLERNGFPVPDFAKDIHLAAFLLYSAATNTESLIAACGIELPDTFANLAKKTLGGFTLERAMPVFGTWLEALPAVEESVFKRIEEENLHQLYWDVEFPLAKILYEMENRGISVQENVLDELGKEYQAKLDDISQKIYDHAGHVFNIGSPKQLGTVLFDELKLTGGGKKRSTAVDVLEKLKGTHPIIDDILEYRMYSKIMSTYIEGLKKYIIEGKIYTTFNQTMTQTGRLSSSDPNLQNISIKSQEGREIRKAFVAPEGYKLLSADYSQVELRMLAHMANEQVMIQAFMNGVDIHNQTASIIFDVPSDQVNEAQRRIAKTVNFAIIYGQTEFGLSQELHITRIQARKFIQAYLANYPNIHRYMENVVEFCKENGYVETMMHRRRAIPEIHDKNFMTREFGKRAAMNAPIQGSAADLIKVAMIKVNETLNEKQMKSQMLLQIHDELIFLVPDEEVDEMMKLVPDVMAGAMNLNVPLQSSVNCGQTWYEAK